MIDTEAIRKKLLDFAVKGKLTKQFLSDGTAEDLLELILIDVYEHTGKKKKYSTEDAPFTIPDNWMWTTLDNITYKIWAGRDKPADFSKEKDELRTIPVIGNGSQNEGILGYTAKATAHKGSITIAGRGTIGSSVYREYDFCPIIRLIVVEQSRLLDAQYLQFVFNTLTAESNGSSIPQLTVPMIKPKLIPLPPLAEQRRIVSILQRAFEQLDIVDELQQQYTSNITSLNQKILELAIQGKLVPQDPNDEPASVLLKKIAEEKQKLIKEGKIKRDKNESSIIFQDSKWLEVHGNTTTDISDEISYELPNGWHWTRLRGIGDWGSGATPSRLKPGYYGGNIPWLKTGDLTDGVITHIPETITEEALAETSVRLNPEGSVLIAMYGATIGKLGILTYPATTNQACCACLPLNGIYNRYLFYFLMAHKKVFIEQGAGGAQPNISKAKIVNTLMPIPPTNEQYRIVSALDKILPLTADLNG